MQDLLDKPAQAELQLDHMPAMEGEMRALFESRWRRWHRAGSFEAAMQDPITANLLALTVVGMRGQPRRSRRRK